MALNINKLKGRIVEKGLTAQKLAPLLNLSEDAMYMKMNQRSEFKRSEIERICQLLEISSDLIPEYFFAQ